MTKSLPIALLACLLWAQAGEARLGIRFTTGAPAEAEMASRELLPVPGITARAGVASPTRAPWIVANGWRFTRQAGAKYRYELPAGKAQLAAAEAFAYNADALLKIDPVDETGLVATMSFFESLPRVDFPVIADLAVVDDGSPATGEVMNLLSRRNLLYEIVKTPSARYRLNVALGSPEFPVADAADPSAFALKIRRLVTDEQRTLRIYGSEVVIARLIGDATRARLHLINYGGREIEGLRIRLRGLYPAGAVYVQGTGRAALLDHVVADGATEFSLPRIGPYALVDLTAR